MGFLVMVQALNSLAPDWVGQSRFIRNAWFELNVPWHPRSRAASLQGRSVRMHCPSWCAKHRGKASLRCGPHRS